MCGAAHGFFKGGAVGASAVAAMQRALSAGEGWLPVPISSDAVGSSAEQGAMERNFDCAADAADWLGQLLQDGAARPSLLTSPLATARSLRGRVCVCACVRVNVRGGGWILQRIYAVHCWVPS
jgi:hypothetical protein